MTTSRRYSEFRVSLGRSGLLTYGGAVSVPSNVESRRSLIGLLRLCLKNGIVKGPPQLMAIGTQLYRLLFPEPVHRAFEQRRAEARDSNEHVRLVLEFQNDAEEAAWPWEYLCQPESERAEAGEFLGAREDVVLSRRLPVNADDDRFRNRSVMRIALVQSEPTPSNKTLRAFLEIAKECGAAVQVRAIERASELVAAIGEGLDVIHFVGQTTGNALMFSDDTVPIDELGRSGAQLVFLQGCRGARLDTYSELGDAAIRLVGAGIPFVLATHYPTAVDQSDSFAREFYTALREAKPIDEAVQAGRAKSIKSLQEDTFDSRGFGCPIVYLQVPDHVIRFPTEATATRPAGVDNDQAQALPRRARRGENPAPTEELANEKAQANGKAQANEKEPKESPQNGRAAASAYQRTGAAIAPTAPAVDPPVAAPPIALTSDVMVVHVELDGTWIRAGLAPNALDCARASPEFIGVEYTKLLAKLRAGAAEVDNALLQEFGAALFASLMTQPVLREYEARVTRLKADGKKASFHLELVFHPAPAGERWHVASLPWEVLFESRVGFLGVHPYLTLTRRLASSPEPVHTKVTGELAILFGYASPLEAKYPNLAVNEELRRLEALDSSSGLKVDATSTPLTRENINERIETVVANAKGAVVFHFSGHGEPGCLVLQDGARRADEYDAETFATLVRDRAAMVVLNACFGATSEVSSPSMACTLITEGIPAVVAMNGKLLDDAAAHFADAFYKALAKGLSPARAAQKGRLQLRSMYGTGKAVWTLPVIYASPKMGALLEPSEGSSPLNLRAQLSAGGTP